MDMYLAGRSKKTFPTYDMAFQSIWVHGAKIGKLTFWWSDIDFTGRLKKTFPTYDMAFRKIWVHGAEIGKLPFWWSDMDFAGHLILLNENEASVNMIKQASAVMTILKELVSLDTVVGSSIVKTVKKGCVKAAGDRVANKGKKRGL